ncbi:hypothetical protein L6452_29980 [Arctium lappa]|uniref:Uncharacterized protein n=1 Tax=Arctium lappa TaxID=4217 RepID=A0ACB8ZIM6_ARCLA|nr:hypothetical protein L6452_29980 [Arctium lappa]
MKTKPMTQDEGSVIMISDEVDSASVGSKAKDGRCSFFLKAKRSKPYGYSSPSQTNEGTVPSPLPLVVNLISSFPENLETSVGVMLQQSLDVAIEATNEILGITEEVSKPSFTMVEVEPPLKPLVAPTPLFDLHRVTKPRTRLGPSLMKNVILALADLDQLLGLNIPPKTTPNASSSEPMKTISDQHDRSEAMDGAVGVETKVVMVQKKIKRTKTKGKKKIKGGEQQHEEPNVEE